MRTRQKRRQRKAVINTPVTDPVKAEHRAMFGYIISENEEEARFLYVERLIAGGYAMNSIEQHVCRVFRLHPKDARKLIHASMVQLAENDGLYNQAQRKSMIRARLDKLLEVSMANGNHQLAHSLMKTIIDVDGLNTPVKVEFVGNVAHDVSFASVHRAIQDQDRRELPDHGDVIDIKEAELVG